MVSSSLRASSSVGDGRRQGLRRQHPLGEVVEPGEVVAPPASGDLTVEEEVLEGDLAVVPVPPRTLLADPLAEVGRRDRPELTDPVEHLVEELRAAVAETVDAVPLVGPIHAPAEQAVLRARRDRRHVRPVLEQLAVVEGGGEHRPGVRAEASEQRQLLAAHEHVHRVDLDDPDAAEHPAQVAPVDAPRRPALGQALGGDGHAPGIAGRQLDHASPRRASQKSSTAARKRPVSSSETSIERARYPRGAR